MAGFTIEIDPTSEDAANTPLALSSPTYRLMAPLGFPEPAVKAQYATSFDVEGSVPADDHQYENREITIPLRVTSASASALATAIGDLRAKQAKINRERGTLKVTAPSGAVRVYDLVEAHGAEELHNAFVHSHRTEGQLAFKARPFGRGTPSAYSAVSETTLPCLVTTFADVGGDVDALGELLIEDLSGVDQWKFWIGLDEHDAASTAGLFYEAEALTPLGSSALAAGATGASGTSNNVVRNTALVPTWQAILSTEHAVDGHLTHVEPDGFRVLGRLYRPTGNTGEVSVRLEWAVGDFTRRTLNAITTYDADDREGVFTLADFGTVYLPEPLRGDARWEGRLLARSTVVGDEIDVDCLFLIPARVYAEIEARLQFETPSDFEARDEFDHTTGNLSDKTAPVGGAWDGFGDAADFTMDTARAVAQRVINADANVWDGRYAVLAGTSAMTATAVQADAESVTAPPAGSQELEMGVLARYTDDDNHLRAVIGPRLVPIPGGSEVAWAAAVKKRVLATDTTLAAVKLGPLSQAPGISWSLRLLVMPSGRFALWAFTGAVAGEPILVGEDSQLATGGALASGKVGLYDANISVSVNPTRRYDNFLTFVPAAVAACFANQSLEYRHDGAIREDSGGTIWSPITVDGRHLRIPPAGPEDRTSRLIVKGTRNDPATMSDPAIDDLRATLTVTPRYLGPPA